MSYLLHETHQSRTTCHKGIGTGGRDYVKVELATRDNLGERQWEKVPDGVGAATVVAEHLIEVCANHRKLVEEYRKLYRACRALWEAPHQEHFVARMNDEEMAALDTIRTLIDQEILGCQQ